jgi:predicted nucleic acid-binding protein
LKKLKIYLDTSVINFLFADDAPDFKEATVDFFEHYVKTGRYEVFISDVVLAEIEKTREKSHRDRLLDVVTEFGLQILQADEETSRLANIYIVEQVIPAKKFDDAQHIAVTTVHQIEILLSWNFKHLANINKQIRIQAINEREGYLHPLILTNPLEVMYEDDNENT